MSGAVIYALGLLGMNYADTGPLMVLTAGGLGGKLFDVYGSYDVVWYMAIGLGLFAGLIHLPIRELKAPAFAAA